MDVRCPQCESENTQAVHMLIAANTHAAQFSGSNLNFSQGGGMGVGSFSGESKTQSQLAAKFTLGAEPGSGAGLALFGTIMLIVGGVSLIGAGKGFVGFSVIGLAMGAVCILGFFAGAEGRDQEMKAWKDRQEYLRKAWVCHRCGKDWAPED